MITIFYTKVQGYLPRSPNRVESVSSAYSVDEGEVACDISSGSNWKLSHGSSTSNSSPASSSVGSPSGSMGSKSEVKLVFTISPIKHKISFQKFTYRA